MQHENSAVTAVVLARGVWRGARARREQLLSGFVSAAELAHEVLLYGLFFVFCQPHHAGEGPGRKGHGGRRRRSLLNVAVAVIVDVVIVFVFVVVVDVVMRNRGRHLRHRT